MVRWWWGGGEVGTAVPGSGREVGEDTCAYKGYQSERLYSIVGVMMMIAGGLTFLLAICQLLQDNHWYICSVNDRI